MAFPYFEIYNLKYKETTHRESSGRGYSRRNTHGWTLSHNFGGRDYRAIKRMVAKYERRQVVKMVGEWFDGEY